MHKRVIKKDSIFFPRSAIYFPHYYFPLCTCIYSLYLPHANTVLDLNEATWYSKIVWYSTIPPTKFHILTLTENCINDDYYWNCLMHNHSNQLADLLEWVAVIFKRKCKWIKKDTKKLAFSRLILSLFIQLKSTFHYRLQFDRVVTFLNGKLKNKYILIWENITKRRRVCVHVCMCWRIEHWNNKFNYQVY